MAPLHVEEKQWRSGTIAPLDAKRHPVKPGKTALTLAIPIVSARGLVRQVPSLRVLIKRGCHHAPLPALVTGASLLAYVAAKLQG
jgi:hypothetical protein